MVLGSIDIAAWWGNEHGLHGLVTRIHEGVDYMNLRSSLRTSKLIRMHRVDRGRGKVAKRTKSKYTTP